MRGWSDHRRQQVRLALLSATGFWLCYFVLWSGRSALLFDDDGRLLLPRLGAALANVPLTLVFLAVLLSMASRPL